MPVIYITGDCAKKLSASRSTVADINVMVAMAKEATGCLIGDDESSHIDVCPNVRGTKS